MNKEKIKQIANYILEREKCIESPNASDKVIQTAKYEIENKMASLSLEELLLVDDFIMSSCK